MVLGLIGVSGCVSTDDSSTLSFIASRSASHFLVRYVANDADGTPAPVFDVPPGVEGTVLFSGAGWSGTLEVLTEDCVVVGSLPISGSGIYFARIGADGDPTRVTSADVLDPATEATLTPLQGSCAEPAAGEDPLTVAASTAEGRAALAACHVGDDDLIPLDRVISVGRITDVGELGHYVSLTGREPLLQETGSAWVITVDADLPQPGSTEVWTDPTCVVTASSAGWLATGPVKDTGTGAIHMPPAPFIVPDRSLPPLPPE